MTEERFDQLLSVMLEFKVDFNQFKIDMNEFKNDMYKFKAEMSNFRKDVDTRFDQLNSNIDLLVLKH